MYMYHVVPPAGSSSTPAARGLGGRPGFHCKSAGAPSPVAPPLHHFYAVVAGVNIGVRIGVLVLHSDFRRLGSESHVYHVGKEYRVKCVSNLV